MGVDKRPRDLFYISSGELNVIKETAEIPIDDASYSGDCKSVRPSTLIKEPVDLANVAQLTADQGVSDAASAQLTADQGVSDAASAQSTANAADGKANANTAAISAIKPSLFGEEIIGNISGSIIVTINIGETLSSVSYIPNLVLFSLSDPNFDNEVRPLVIFNRTLTSFKVRVEEKGQELQNLNLGWSIDGVFRL